MWSKILDTIATVFLVGLVIKIMDDYLDQEIDRLNERKTLAIKLQRGVVPYTLLLFSFAVLINYQLTISLFWASYIIGMGISNNSLPTGLKSYQEVLIMLGLGFLVLQWKLFLFTLAIILFIQLIDDFIDFHLEDYINRDNFVNYLGEWGTILLALLSLIIALQIDWKTSFIIMIITLVVVRLLKIHN
ncbi:hypothetical protein MWH25_09430 [Natroniella acetigena]|uniref:hypothetical protein n=1 Tax=Natroniella acetigena TaxID=52004 RepID=UPI00200B3C63|nr:hypothetical protein [Natroniella acetigena]MCK8827959.1 hypothetical protein [Natroniella acetigena]